MTDTNISKTTEEITAKGEVNAAAQHIANAAGYSNITDYAANEIPWLEPEQAKSRRLPLLPEDAEYAIAFHPSVIDDFLTPDQQTVAQALINMGDLSYMARGHDSNFAYPSDGLAAAITEARTAKAAEAPNPETVAGAPDIKTGRPPAQEIGT